MAVSGPKSIAPIEQAVISPINESTTFTPGNTIIFRISASDMRYWLVQDSYFCFDVVWTNPNGSVISNNNKNFLIRNTSTFFNNVRIIHGGNEVYYSQYNIAQQFLDYVKTGDDFIRNNYNEWMSYDSFASTYPLDQPNLNLVLMAGNHFPNLGAAADTVTKRGYIMHVGQILKCLSQCENFPLRNCPQAIEIRLQLASPKEFVCVVETGTSHNLYDLEGNINTSLPAGAVTGNVVATEIAEAPGLTYQITNMKLYMFGAQVQDSYASVVEASNASGQGLMWEFTMPRINLRNEPARQPGYQISNFQCITENTDKMYVWGVRHSNLGVTIRPYLTNMNLRFGAHQLPKSPTAEDNWNKPALYKELVDDALEYNTAYYTSPNKDLQKSYAGLIGINTTNAQANPSNHDTHILMAASFTTDDKHPGAPSKMWNSQYNLHYQLLAAENPMTWVLAVDTQYVLSLRQGMLSSTNI